MEREMKIIDKYVKNIEKVRKTMENEWKPWKHEWKPLKDKRQTLQIIEESMKTIEKWKATASKPKEKNKNKNMAPLIQCKKVRPKFQGPSWNSSCGLSFHGLNIFGLKPLLEGVQFHLPRGDNGHLWGL